MRFIQMISVPISYLINKKKLLYGAVTVIIWCMFSFVPSFCEDARGPADAVVIKEARGQLIFISTTALGITYKSDSQAAIEYEMVFFVDQNTSFENKPRLPQLDAGELVKVEYAQVRRGGVLKRIAKRVVFIRPSVPSFGLKGFKG